MKTGNSENLIDKIVSLCKRRGFIFPGSEIYGGLANSWDYGPLGVELKNNIKQLWWKKFVQERDDVVGIDAALIMNRMVWANSGHLQGFKDWLMECKKCHERYRDTDFATDEDRMSILKKIPGEPLSRERMEKFHKEYSKFVIEKSSKITCKNCGGKDFTEPRAFNLLLKTFLGPAEDEAHMVYFRPETAQSMFVNFKNILDTTRKTLPFGIAQIGKAFRNEITPGNFIFRTREFEQMEIEYFIKAEDWQKFFEHWQAQMHLWLSWLGINPKKVHELEVPDGERAHYSKKTIDFEYDFPFGRKELYGLAYRTDFDLKNHFKEAPYKDPQTNEIFWPHVIEPTWGVDRSVLAVLCEAYDESDPDRLVLKLKPNLAPYKAAVFPLLANKPQLVELARKIYDDLRKDFSVTFDDRGNIGKRYYSQDEIGTLLCITVDFDTLGEENPKLKDTVTVRDRDTAKQERIKINELNEFIKKSLK